MSLKPSRTTLVSFFNDTLQLRIAKVDELGTGAAYCQLLDSVFGDVPMHRVKFDTRAPLEMEQNFKVLQQTFIVHRINYNFDATRLMKCRLQDNLDFSQWLYQFWHESPHIEGYDPVTRRLAGGNTKIRKVSPSSQPPHSTSLTNGSRSRPVQAPDLNGARTPARPAVLQTPHNPSAGSYNIAPYNVAGPHNTAAVPAQQRIDALEAEIDELGKAVDVLHEERKLYYEKLLDIEQLVDQQLNRIYSTRGAVAGMEHATDPEMIFIRQLQEVLFSSPDGFQPQMRPEDEPF